MRLRIAVVMAVLAAALLLPGLARAEGDQGTPTDVVAAAVTGFSDGNGVPVSGSTNGFADGNGVPTGSADGFSDGNSGVATGATAGGSVTANFGMSDGNG